MLNGCRPRTVTSLDGHPPNAGLLPAAIRSVSSRTPARRRLWIEIEIENEQRFLAVGHVSDAPAVRRDQAGCGL